MSIRSRHSALWNFKAFRQCHQPKGHRRPFLHFCRARVMEVMLMPTPMTSWLGVFQSSMRQSMSMSSMGKYMRRYSSIWRSVICE